jgi:hypothetical protein
MPTFSGLPIICVLIQPLVVLVLSQSAGNEWPRLNTSVKYDLTGNSSLLISLNNSNLLPDKYEALQIKGNYLTRTTINGELEMYNLTDLTLSYNLFKNITSQVVAFDIA